MRAPVEHASAAAGFGGSCDWPLTFRPTRDQCLYELVEPCAETTWRARRAFLRGGTNGSNPAPSSSESGELPYCGAGSSRSRRTSAAAATGLLRRPQRIGVQALAKALVSGNCLDGIWPRKSGSHQTPRWREGDSNPWSPNSWSRRPGCLNAELKIAAKRPLGSSHSAGVTLISRPRRRVR
jgi:hypothetical protein